MKNLFRPCPICDNLNGEILHTQLFSLPHHSPLPKKYDVVFCTECGFVFADTPVNQIIYNKYYTLLSKYEDLTISTGGGGYIYDYLRIELSTTNIQRILPNHTSTILDMGCANGGLLKSLKLLGYQNLLGIDPSISCNNHVNNLGIHCIQGDIFSETFIQLTQTFDCIILTHVLEHIFDLSVAIKNLSSKLNDNGILYIEVPDASRYSDYYMVPYYYIDCEHINHFDHYSLSNLITSKGFVQIETKNIEFSVNESNSYPAVYSIFQKSGFVNRAFQKSDSSKISFLDFIEQSKNNHENDHIINRLVESREPIIIWGAGQFTLRLLANSDLGKCNIQGFVDSDFTKQGKVLDGKSISNPDILKHNNSIILICSALHSNNIHQEIIKMGIANLVYIMK